MNKVNVRSHIRHTKFGIVKVNSHLRSLSYPELKRAGFKIPANKDFDGDGVKNKFDCKPLNKKEQGLIHLNIHKLKQTKEYKRLSVKNKRILNRSLNTLSKAKTTDEIKIWFKENRRKVIGAVGIGAAAFLSAGFASIGLGAGFAVVPERKLEKQFRQTLKKIPGTRKFKRDESILFFRTLTRKDDASLFKSPTARRLFINKDKEVFTLTKKGFSRKQSDAIVESRILKAESNFKKR